MQLNLVILQSVTNENVSQEDLGGAMPHTTISGVAHKSFKNDIEALRELRYFLTFLPQACNQSVPIRPCSQPW